MIAVDSIGSQSPLPSSSQKEAGCQGNQQKRDQLETAGKLSGDEHPYGMFHKRTQLCGAYLCHTRSEHPGETTCL